MSVRLRIKFHPNTGLEQLLYFKVDDVEGMACHPAVIDEIYERVRGLCTVKVKDARAGYSDYLFECPTHAVDQIKRLITELGEEGWIVER